MSTISRPRSKAEILSDLDHIEALLSAQRAAPSYRAKLKIGRQIASAQAAERSRFNNSLDLRPLLILLGSHRNCSVLALNQRARWCEPCGGTCERTDDSHGGGFQYEEGFYRAGGPRQLYAVLVHAAWHFECIDTFAQASDLRAQLVGWSWWGPEFTAALITRRADP
jgi:hypothetical protein